MKELEELKTAVDSLKVKTLFHTKQITPDDLVCPRSSEVASLPSVKQWHPFCPELSPESHGGQPEDV